VPTRKEALEAIRHLKDYKAPGDNNICDELNKNGGLEWWKEMQALIAVIWIN
jgi:hypothetical protein